MRSALHWTSDETFAQAAAAKLAREGWQLHPTSDALHASSIARQNNFRVGLATFDPAVVSLRAVQDVVLASRAMEWIALVPSQCAVMREVKQVIVDSCFDYHTMPPDWDRLCFSLGHAYGVAELRSSSEAPGAPGNGKFSMIGRSPAMQSLYEAIERINSSDAAVLITGETGTGKELVARALHQTSSRRDAPFVAMNCAALPLGLIQAELFGYERGAFTDARERKIGRIETAAGGTVFLDEIGDLPLAAQAMLLRFLQEHAIERLGGKTSIHIDVRVIAATHADLESLIAENRFREDLYYRLNVLRVRVPALRERQRDIELLAHTMLERFAAGASKRIRGYSRAALDRMTSHSWPGNVRELINRVHGAVVMCEGRLIVPKDLGLERRALLRELHRLEESREQAERQAIREALMHNRTVQGACDELGVSRMTLYRRLAKYGLRTRRP